MGHKSSKSIQQLQIHKAVEGSHIIMSNNWGYKENHRVQVLINRKTMRMELDNGATISVISENKWNQLFSAIDNLKSYTGKSLHGYLGSS